MVIKVRRRKNNQFGVAQLAHIASLPLSGGARPLHLLSGWLWWRKWFAVHNDHARRSSGAEVNDPLFVGFRPLDGRVGYGRLVEKGHGGSKFAPSERWRQAVFDGRDAP